MIYYFSEAARFPVGVAQTAAVASSFEEVEIFFAFLDALLNAAKREVIYMVMTWELFFLFCTLIIAVIRLVMDIYNKKR